MPHPVFHASIAKMSGGAARRIKGSSGTATGSFTKLFYLLVWSIISLSISGIIVQWAYNQVMPSIYASYSDKPFVPLEWTDAMILVLLTHALIW